MISSGLIPPEQNQAIPSRDQLLEEIAALRRIVANRDNALLSLTQRMDRVIEEVRAERDRLDKVVKREQKLSELVRRVLASMRDALIVTDPEGVIVQANAATYRELGYGPDALLGIMVDVLLPPEVLAAYERALPVRRVVSASVWVETIAGRRSYLEEHELLNRAGRVAGIFRVGAEIFHSAQGKFEGVVITASNFTQRIAVEQALVESETRLQSMLDGSPIPLFVIDLEHRITHWNQACEAMTGMPAAEMIGTRNHWRPFYDSPRPCLVDVVLEGADSSEVMRYYGSSVRDQGLSGRILEGEGYFPRLGKSIFFTATSIRDSQGKIVAAMESVQDFTQRKEAERALAESETRLRNILDGSPIPLFVIDGNHRLTHWNRACEVMTGVSAERMMGTRDYWQPFYDSPRPCLIDMVLEGVDPKEIERYYGASVHNRILSELVYEGEGYYPTVQKWLSFTAAPIRDSQGHIVAAMETVQDITERKEAEEALRRSETRFRSLFEEVPSVAIQGYGPDGTIRYWNKASENLYGYTAGEVIGQGLLELIVPPKMRERAFDAIRSIVTSRKSRPAEELQLMRKDGSLVTVLSSHAVIPTLDSKSEVEFYRLDVDLSELKRAQERLRLAASVFEHAHEGIMITDAAGTIIDVNKTFVEITGYSREEVIGHNPRLLKSGRHDAAFYAHLWQIIAEHGYWHGEIWNRRKSGQVYPEITSISAVHNAKGVIIHYVGLFADISVLKESQQRLEKMAYYDPLTRLPNRALLADRLQLALSKAQREQRILAACYLDLDGFKPINDTWGHAAGDDLLIQVAQRLQSCVRDNDTVARLGGDEFVVLLDDLHTLDEGERALQRILEALSAPFALGAATVTVSASVGAAFFPSDGTDPDTLLRHADQAMYSAKQGGRNCYHLFDSEHNRRAQTHRELLERVGQGLVAGEFCLYYQPKVDMRCGKVIGAEALIRWRHPEQGILAPDAFIAVVENSDLAQTVGDWVLGTAMKQMAVWAAEGLTLPVSVNISARHLQQPDFAARVQALLAHHSSIQPEWLELEILETTALDEIEQFSRIIADCRQLGVRFALDDFGTGYCSLTYLRHLPAQILKIDQSFIRNMLDSPDDLAIVRGVIGLSSAFKRDIIAEGVETIEHGVLLLQLGCDYAQGYAIARPMPAEEVPGWVRAWRNPEEWNGSRRHSR